MFDDRSEAQGGVARVVNAVLLSAGDPGATKAAPQWKSVLQTDSEKKMGS
jgi:hypothetical protein